MGIRIKILSGFLILAMMLLVAGAWSIYELTNIGVSVQKLLDDNYKSINAAKIMIEALEREDSAILLLLSGKWEEGRLIMKSADESFNRAFQAAESNVTIPGERSYVEAVGAAYKKYQALWLRPIVDTKREGNLKWYFEDVHKAFQDTKVSVEQLMTLNDRAMYKTASDLKERAHRATMPGVVAIVSSFVFAVIFSYLINYYVINPIIRITKGIKGYLQSEQTLDVKIETNDELSELASSVNSLIARTRT